MAKYDIKSLNYITCGKKQNTFNVTFRYTDDGMILSSVTKPSDLSIARTTTFFGDVGEYESMSQRYATNCESFYDIDNKVIMHNLYELPKTKLKTTAMKHSSLSVSTDNIDIYVPPISDDFIKVVQFENYAYGLTKMMQSDPVTLSVLLQNETGFDVNYHYVLSNGTQLTFTHPKPNEIDSECQTYKQLLDNSYDMSSQVLANIFQIKRDLSGLYRNYVVEIPEDKKYNNYLRGYINCDQIVAKNHLDYTYTLSTTEDFDVLSCRDYCNIDVCGGQLYMTYRDNVNYKKTDSQYDGTVSYNDNKQADYDPTVIKHDLTKIQQKDTYTYQHIEVINSWNRWDGGGAGHKSSLFSLVLHDTGLNEAMISENVKTKLRQNIMNNIRSIIDNFTPANTQLFNIYFEGK